MNNTLRRVEHTINVTEEHIKRGVRKSRSQCPVAIALSEQRFDGCKGRPEVYLDRISFITGTWRRWAAEVVPLAVSRFIEAFDAGIKPEPASFTFTFIETPVNRELGGTL